jgi:pilus assembly protein Flp/PilA
MVSSAAAIFGISRGRLHRVRMPLAASPLDYASIASHRAFLPQSIPRGGEIFMARLYALVTSVLARGEEGQGLAEYALILVLIAIVAVLALIFLGAQVSKMLSTVGASV